tara:strand:+ start:3735 stop:4769 length:1035 start_codon:yes stop_codon:yes gene_type:complete
MSTSTYPWPKLLESILLGKNLTDIEAKTLMKAWLGEELTAVQTGAFLSALRSKGVSGVELSSMAAVLREACSLPCDLPSIPMVDTCGTGGDGADTFNISTAVAFLSASCGANIAKHGNRSASGKVGSADVLEGLGLRLDAPLSKVVEAITVKKISFLFAPAWHPSLVNLAPLRKSLGIRTIFNLLGPLVNPLRPKAQVLGVAKSDLLDPMAEALQKLGLERAVVVYGAGGLDEASLQGPNQIRFLEHGKITSLNLDPSYFGLSTISNDQLKGGDLNTNINILSSLLKGSGNKPQNNVVALNNSLVLWAGGIEKDLKSGFARSLDNLNAGEAWTVFENLKSFLNE